MPVYVMLIPYGAPRLTPAQLLPARGPKCVNKKKKNIQYVDCNIEPVVLLVLQVKIAFFRRKSATLL